MTPTSAEATLPPPAPVHWRHPDAWKGWLRAGWPALTATALLLIFVAITVYKLKRAEHGHLVYPIDDVYIHMAIAKNLLHHGTWGVSYQSGFSFCSSSLLWPLLVALVYAIFGIHESYPLIMNVVAAIGALFYTGSLLRRTTGSSVLSVLVLLLVVVLTPLMAAASTGMEHCLQILCCVIFVDLAARVLTLDAPQRLASRSAEIWLCAAALAMTMTRYEGMFLVAPVGLLLLCQRRWALAVTLGLVTAAPVVIAGLVAASKGWYFLPTSLVIKGNMNLVPSLQGFYDYFHKWYDQMLSFPGHMFSLLLGATVALIAGLQRRGTIWTYPAIFLFVTVLAMLQHLQFAGLGWFYRYEAYLIVLSFVGIGVSLGYEAASTNQRYWLSVRALPHYGALGLAALLLGVPLWTRAGPSMQGIIAASYNVYGQQYQMGHFIHRFYQNKGVAANDVGAIDYFADIDLMDTAGLTDIDVLRARRAETFNHETFRRLAKKHHVELVMIYDEWVGSFGGVLPEWVPVGQWKIPHNTVLGSDHVTFYAPGSEQVPQLIANLKAYSSSLPLDVEQEGIYNGSHPLNATGVYAAEGTPDLMAYWSGAWAQFYVYPAEGEPLDSDDTTMNLAVYPATGGQTIDVYFNEKLVETKKLGKDEFNRWVPFTIKAKWRKGVNMVKLDGHGVQYHPPGDGRTLLFMTLDPRQQMDATGRVTKQRP